MTNIIQRHKRKEIKSLFRRINKNLKLIMSNFELSFNVSLSIMGFILGQFVWIWILKGFLNWFVLWFSEVTKYHLGTVYRVTSGFWILYAIWFMLCILFRLKIEKETGDEK